MARIKFSGLVTEIRGSVGGTTFQRNAYGYTVKNKANMVNPNSLSQQTQQTTLFKCVNSWGQLTSAQRDEVDSWASANPQYSKNNPDSQLSGFAVWVRWWIFNITYRLNNYPSYVGVYDPVPAIAAMTFTLTSLAGVLTLGRVALPDDNVWAGGVFLSPSTSESKNFAGSSLRFINDFVSTTGTSDITSQYTNVFGAIPTPGQTILGKYGLLHENSLYATAYTSFKITVA